MLQFIRIYFLRRRARNLRRRWIAWYLAHPCKASYLMPWSDKDYS